MTLAYFFSDFFGILNIPAQLLAILSLNSRLVLSLQILIAFGYLQYVDTLIESDDAANFRLLYFYNLECLTESYLPKTVRASNSLIHSQIKHATSVQRFKSLFHAQAKKKFLLAAWI